MGTICLLGLASCNKHEEASKPQGAKVLIFSKTQAFRHECIEPGVKAITTTLAKYGLSADHTEDSTKFTVANLKNYDAILFFQTTGNVLGEEEQAAMENFIHAGKGFVGIHAAADTEYDWRWYNWLVGAKFSNHPDIQSHVLVKTDSAQIACTHLPARWTRTDEIYNFKEVAPDVKVELTADEATYTGGAMGNNHPMSWYHEYDGGRAYYIAMGHTVESYQDSLFLEHIAKATLWAAHKK